MGLFGKKKEETKGCCGSCDGKVVSYGKVLKTDEVAALLRKARG